MPEPTVTNTPRRSRSDERSPEARREARQRRVQIDGLNLELSVPEFKQPGYTLLWADEVKTQGYYEEGAEYVQRDEAGIIGDGPVSGNTDIGERVSRVVGHDKRGNPRTNVLLKMKTEWYEQDQAQRQRINESIDEAISRGELGRQQAGGESTYLKEHSATVTT